MKKHRVKIIIGWVLIVAQCLGILGNLMGGNFEFTGIANALGYFSYGIVGIILLIIGYSQNYKGK